MTRLGVGFEYFDHTPECLPLSPKHIASCPFVESVPCLHHPPPPFLCEPPRWVINFLWAFPDEKQGCP